MASIKYVRMYMGLIKTLHLLYMYVHVNIRTFGIIEMADGGELSAEHLELRLIQSKQDIENPPSLQSAGITAINL